LHRPRLLRVHQHGHIPVGDNNLGVGRFCQLKECFDGLELQHVGVEPLRDDVLCIPDTFGFDTAALRFLLCFLQDELHSKGTLLGFQFFLDSPGQVGRQLNALDQHRFDEDPAFFK